MLPPHELAALVPLGYGYYQTKVCSVSDIGESAFSCAGSFLHMSGICVMCRLFLPSKQQQQQMMAGT